MTVIKTRTIDLNHVLEGPADAPVVMFSNSLGADLSMWQAQADFLGSEYRVLRYDQRGHGASAVPPAPYSFADLTDDAVALMDALEIERVHFVGLSMGGMTALGLALDHHARVASITACNCVAAYAADGQQVWADRIATVSAGGLEAVIDGTIARWFTEPTIAARPAQMEAVREMVLATPLEGYLGCCGALRELDYLARLGEITVPTLFVAGSHDAGAPAATMRDMHQRVAGSGYVELEAAHVSNLERSEAFNQALHAFLGGL